VQIPARLRLALAPLLLGAGPLLQPLTATTLFYDGDGTAAGQTYTGLTTTASGTTVSGSVINTSLGSTIGGTGVDTTVWLSFIGYRSAVAQGDNSTSAFNVDLTRGSTADVIGVGGYRSSYTTTGSLNGNTTYDNPTYWAVTALDGSAVVGQRTNISAFGTPGDFILLKIDYNVATKSDTLSLWINPALAAGESGLGAAVVQLANLDLGSFNGVRLYAGSNAIFNVDEIRLATTFDTVVPEPSTYALLLGAGVLGAAAWRRRRR
jgi:hypothetical protein